MEDKKLEKHIKNLIEYIKDDSVYQKYKKNQNSKFDAVDLEDLKHCIDIEQVLEALEKTIGLEQTKIDYQKYLKQKKQIKELQNQVNYMNVQIDTRNKTIAKLERKLEKTENKETEKRLNVLEARNIMLLKLYNDIQNEDIRQKIKEILKIGEKE